MHCASLGEFEQGRPLLEELKKERETSKDYLRVILKGSKKDLKSFNIQSIKDIGIDVKTMEEEISIEKLEQRVSAYNEITLNQEFVAFCKKEKLTKKDGLKYFNQINNV